MKCRECKCVLGKKQTICPFCRNNEFRSKTCLNERIMYVKKRGLDRIKEQENLNKFL